MSDLEKRLAEARERLYREHSFAAVYEGFDVAANIAREVVAEKDRVISRLYSFAEIQRYQAALAEKDAEIVRWRTWATEMPDYGWDLDGPIRAWYDDAP